MFYLVYRSIRIWLIFFTYLVILQVTQFSINCFSFSLVFLALLSPNCYINNMFNPSSPVCYCRSITGNGWVCQFSWSVTKRIPLFLELKDKPVLAMPSVVPWWNFMLGILSKLKICLRCTEIYWGTSVCLGLEDGQDEAEISSSKFCCLLLDSVL